MCLAGSAGFGQAAKPYSYTRVGADQDAVTQPQAGYALMGGGTDLDEAFSWLCERAHGGDFLILRAAGTDAYNPYVQKLCKLNSVATLILPSREAAMTPFAAEAIAHAEAIFISGGDQANYIRYWTGTPVQAAINAAIKHGVPIGGTSAGLAVMGEWAFSAEGDKPDDPNLSGKDALIDPFSKRITLVHGFIEIPILDNTITDSHFAKRDRMGRLLTFLFRLSETDGKALPTPKTFRGIGIDENTAVLLDADGHAKTAGSGAAYFVKSNNNGSSSDTHSPLELLPIDVQKVASGHSFDLNSWNGEATSYSLTVRRGEIHSSKSDGVY